MSDGTLSLSIEDLHCDDIDAQARALALFLLRNPDARERQVQRIRSDLGEAVARQVEREAARVDRLGRGQRLPLLESTLPRLAGLQAADAGRLLATVDALIHANGGVSLTEYLFARLLGDTLQAPRSARPTRTEVGPLRRHCTLLLSVVANAGHHSEPVVAEAFARGVAAAPLDGLGTLVPISAIRARAIDQALDALAATAQPFRDALLRALAVVARHDGRVTPAETELLHTIGTALRSIAHVTIEPDPTIEEIPSPEIETDEAALEIADPAAFDAQGSLSTRDRLPVQALVVANLIPLFGVLFFGWDARNLLLLYWMENLVVGAFTLLRMLHAGGFKALFPSAFFTFHYSFFCAGHGIFILMISSLGSEEPDAFGSIDEGMFPFGVLWNLFDWIALHAPGLLLFPLAAFVVSHGISTVVHHFIGKEDAGRDADDIMFDPYKRIAALHIAILAGSFAVIGSGGGSAAPALMILIAFKIVIDLHQHRSAHRKRRAQRNARHEDSPEPPIEP